ncbi:MAG: phospholipase D-like domain-containing protein [Bacteroidaceae bacterium]|nr:phospholipase D-like domain-containing protein [Bacteroidaceae bacterium]
MKLRRTLIDNSPEGYNMTEVLKECLEDTNITEVCIATGFWDLRGTTLVYDELASFLSREGAKFRLLIGKDPYLYSGDTESFTKGRYDKQEQAWRVELDKFAAQEQYVKTVQLLVDNLKDKDNEKFQIHIYKPEGELKDQFLHSKCFIFKGYDNEEDCPVGYGIIGSSNFTQRGMEGNAELNTLEDNARDVISLDPEFRKDKTHLMWFNEKWDYSESWEKEFLLQITQSKMAPEVTIPEPETSEVTNKPLTPYELYIKLLQTKFGDLVDKKFGDMIESYLPCRFDSFDYQMDAVKQCFSTMKQHGGFMLADVVGLGKTIVGTLVIKHFLNFPDEDGRERKVLIVTPPAIRSSWIDTIKEFDKDCVDPIGPCIDYITTGSIGKLVDDEVTADDESDSGSFETELKTENYGLIIIDESHKFRNSDNGMYRSLDELIEQIGCDTGNYPYIGLLSATPQNNRPNDLKNQIYLFERNHNESTLKKANGGNIESFFTEINAEYVKLITSKESDKDADEYASDDMSPVERQEKLKELSGRIRDCILSDIMVRRTRTDVKEYYKNDIERQGIAFPDINGPIGLKYKMSSKLANLFYETMSLIAPKENFRFDNSDYLCYYRYRAVQFLTNPDDKKLYAGRGNRDTDTLALQLAKIMQINLVKRLESSFTAFKQSLLNLRRYTDNMIRMWENNTIFICPAIDVNTELDVEAKKQKRGHNVSFDECVEDIRKKILKLTEDGRNEDGENKEYTRDDFDSDYINLLRHDYKLVCDLYDKWSLNSEDPKFDEFKESLRYVLFDKERNRPQKLVIFTEAIDTATTISDAAQSKGYRVLMITAANRHDKEQTIRENFDANYKGEWKNDYDIIVTTDVLAEGINLHRANCILNYDTPWNSTKLMQRIGRVNRIGSAEKFVYVFNFMPSAEGDAEINLVRKAHTKLQSFHTLFGEDSKVFSEDEEVAHYKLNEIVNGEASPLEKYVYELKEYKASHPERYAQIEAQNEELEMSAVPANGNGYFLVRTPKMAGMFVKVNPNEDEGKVISIFDMFETVRPMQAAQKCGLPDNWGAMKKEAERVVTAELADARFRKGNSKKATEAKGIIKELRDNQTMSAESRKLLSAADKLVRYGNNDIIKRIIKIGQAVAEKNALFPITQEEFDAYLNDGIAKMVAEVEMRQGKPQVFIGINK